MPNILAGGQDADRFDFNCHDVEEKQYDSLASSLCCATVGGPRLAISDPGCNLSDWNASSVNGVPACKESATFQACEMTETGCVRRSFNRPNPADDMGATLRIIRKISKGRMGGSYLMVDAVVNWKTLFKQRP